MAPQPERDRLGDKARLLSFILSGDAESGCRPAMLVRIAIHKRLRGVAIFQILYMSAMAALRVSDDYLATRMGFRLDRLNMTVIFSENPF